MTISFTMLLIIIGCCLVTLIPRITPFIIVKKATLPAVVQRWLSYIPVCILTALIIQGIWTQQDTTSNSWYQQLEWNWGYLLALVPTILIAIFTRSLAITVIVGVISMALLRLWLPHA